MCSASAPHPHPASNTVSPGVSRSFRQTRSSLATCASSSVARRAGSTRTCRPCRGRASARRSRCRGRSAGGPTPARDHACLRAGPARCTTPATAGCATRCRCVPGALRDRPRPRRAPSCSPPRRCLPDPRASGTGPPRGARGPWREGVRSQTRDACRPAGRNQFRACRGRGARPPSGAAIRATPGVTVRQSARVRSPSVPPPRRPPCACGAPVRSALFA